MVEQSLSLLWIGKVMVEQSLSMLWIGCYILSISLSPFITLVPHRTFLLLLCEDLMSSS